jgi:hypothetical protein
MSARDLIPASLDLFVGLGRIVHQPPGRDHGMNMLIVQCLQRKRNIGIALVEDWVALAPLFPPVPILHKSVHRDVARAILRCNV